MKNKSAIHIQLYEPHFNYGINLVKGLKTNTGDFAEYDIFILTDTEEIKEKFRIAASEILVNKNVNLLSLENVLEKDFDHLEYNENYEQCHKNISDGKSVFSHWGSSFNHVRKWLCIKRAYGILELERRGYDYVWCIDAESYPKRPFNISEIFSSNWEKTLVSVSEEGGWNDTRITTEVFGYDPSKEITQKLMKCGVRINDFWIINTSIFKSMINELTQKHRNPVSYFIVGCEQAAYELYCYYNYLNGNMDIECIEFGNKVFGDLFDSPVFPSESDVYLHDLFSWVIHTNTDISKFIGRMNQIYFNKVLCYRGDMSRSIPHQGFEQFNIKFLCSNAQ